MDTERNNRLLDELVDEQILFRDENYLEMSDAEREHIADNIRWLLARRR